MYKNAYSRFSQYDENRAKTHNKNMDLMYFCGFSGVFNGSLDLFRFKYDIKLPDNMEIVGMVDFRDSGMEIFPKMIKIKSDVFLEYSNITQLPSDLVIGGDLYAHLSDLTSLPNNLTVNGDLHIGDCKIKKLPKCLVVGGNVNLGDCGVIRRYDWKWYPKGIGGVTWSKRKR